MQSLNLPGSLQALEKPLGLPLSLTSHAEELRQQDGVHRIQRSMRDVDMLKADDVGIYKEGVELLQQEASEDESVKLKYGTDRWNRQPSQQAAERLYSQVAEIDNYLKSAGSSDELVKKKLRDCEGVLTILGGTDRHIEDYVPSSRRATMLPRVEREAGRLRTMLNEVNRFENRRRRKIENLREKAKGDDISKILILKRDLHHSLTRS